MELRVRQLAKKFNGRVIFEGISCCVLAGEPCVVTGPNGSGKSTLLKILCGLLRPTAGSVEFALEGRRLVPREIKDRLGYVSPEVNLYDRLTAFENLAFFAALRGVPTNGAGLKDLLGRVQLGDFVHYPVGHYSSGMKQRLKLAAALLHRPAVLLLDEPSTNLDEGGRYLLEEIIGEQKEKGLVIIATNEPGEVARFGRKILRLGTAPVGPG